MGVIGDIAGALIGSRASRRAADAQSRSAELGVAELRRQYDQTRGDLEPWRQAGGQAIGNLSEMLQPGYDHTTSPGYEFRRGEAMRGMENNAVSRGMLLSGGTLRGIGRIADGMAASDFTDQFNRTASVAAGGQQVNTTLGQLGAQSANGISDLRTQQGNARASGYIGSANSWINGIGNFDRRVQSVMGGMMGAGGGG